MNVVSIVILKVLLMIGVFFFKYNKIEYIES